MNYGYCKRQDNYQSGHNWCIKHRHISTILLNGTIASCRSCQYWQIPKGENDDKE